jgi:hypothetical protein
MEPGNFFDITLFDRERLDTPFVIPWPLPGNPAGLLEFHRYPDWHTFISVVGVHEAIPHIVASKFERAQRLYLLAWIDMGLVKAGELVALSALELALKDRYGAYFREKYVNSKNKRLREQGPSLSELLEHLVRHDGLTDSQLPFTLRYGGSIIPALLRSKATGDPSIAQIASRPMLSDIRNALAHGDPFDSLPWSGLLELVRDLIQYAYRTYLQEYDDARRA